MARAGATAEATLAELGICFLFAANHHPAMRRIQPIRQAIGRRTIFNLMGPLANPARVDRQLVGVARADYVPTYAGALALLGTGRSWVVSGDEGLDEISIAGATRVGEVAGSVARYRALAPEEAGLPRHPIAALRGATPRTTPPRSAACLRARRGPIATRCCSTAAAALLLADRAADLREGASRAAEAIDDGRAAALLARWIAY